MIYSHFSLFVVCLCAMVELGQAQPAVTRTAQQISQVHKVADESRATSQKTRVQNITDKPRAVLQKTQVHKGADESRATLLKAQVHEIAAKAGIPLIQVAYWDGKELISFESSQSDSLKESADCSSVFQAASLSKPVLAYIVLKMADEGRIDMDMPLYKYTDIDRFTNKEWAKLLTARMVLTHRTGLADWAASPSSAGWPTSPIEFVCRPDSCFGYSGEGIAFLQRAVENIREKSLQQIAQEDVFTPYGMNHSSFEWKGEYDSIAVPGFNKEGTNRGVRRFPGANAAYTLRTTASDYMKFLKVIASGTGLKAGTHKAQLTPVVHAPYYLGQDRPEDKNIFWAICLGVEKNEELGNIIFHWGDNGNFKGLFLIVPGDRHAETRAGIKSTDAKPKNDRLLVYFTNSAHGHDIINQLTPLFLHNKQPLQISSWIGE